MLLQLLRTQQWYKNLLIFLPLVFVGLALDQQSIMLTILGFIALCLLSSTNYILHDIIDQKKDQVHPEKRERPIAAGKVSVPTAGFIAMLCATSSLILAMSLSPIFFYLELFFFALTLLYSLWLKQEIFLDIILIAVNYVIRAVAGAYILQVRVSPWLILCTFFLALFLAAGKRRADVHFLEHNAGKHKTVLKSYTKELTNALIQLATALLILSYSLYSFLSIYPHLIYSLPFSLYVILRYYYLVESNSPIPRKPHTGYRDKQLAAGVVIWILVVLFLIYAT
jgi:4-hydroxybenzoate polyprenyltransferase